MNYKIIPVTPFQQNCSLVWCEQTRRAALIDPGGEPDKLLAALEREGLTLEKVLLTHAHVDHVGAARALAEAMQVPIEGPQREDAFWLEMLPAQAEMFGFAPIEPFTPDRWLEEGEAVTVGNERLEVLHCPGHTPGHVVFYHRGDRLAFVGDVLFHGSVGRTDFPRGDYRTLIDAIENKLLPLGDEVTFIPGHGPLSTFGEERRSNPFLQG